MRLHLTILSLQTLLFANLAGASENSWMFLPGFYTHSPETGKRVAQYQPEAPAYLRCDPTYQESGYRHQVLEFNGDVSNIVQTWGAGTAIRPYGEWEFPYRAGATPFGPWGNPQGPWTMPFDSWQNPYGLGRLPYGQGLPYGSQGNGPMGGGGFPGQQFLPGQMPWMPSPSPYSGHAAGPLPTPPLPGMGQYMPHGQSL